LIYMDIGVHPPIPTGSHAIFIIGIYFLDFRVLNFQGRFEALNNVLELTIINLFKTLEFNCIMCILHIDLSNILSCA
jgi:hypothetical protein